MNRTLILAGILCFLCSTACQESEPEGTKQERIARIQTALESIKEEGGTKGSVDEALWALAKEAEEILSRPP